MSATIRWSGRWSMCSKTYDFLVSKHTDSTLTPPEKVADVICTWVDVILSNSDNELHTHLHGKYLELREVESLFGRREKQSDNRN